MWDELAGTDLSYFFINNIHVLCSSASFTYIAPSVVRTLILTLQCWQPEEETDGVAKCVNDLHVS